MWVDRVDLVGTEIFSSVNIVAGAASLAVGPKLLIEYTVCTRTILPRSVIKQAYSWRHQQRSRVVFFRLDSRSLRGYNPHQSDATEQKHGESQQHSHEHVHVVLRIASIRVGERHRPQVGLACLMPLPRAELDMRWHVLRKQIRARKSENI